MDQHEITSVAQLRELYRPPSGLAAHKLIDHIDRRCGEFIALSPFLVLASSGADGSCDASPKGGPPGFVKVLGEHHLLIPDARGNRLLDGLQNMVANPHIGLVFLIPGMGETLRVNGRARLTRDPELLERCGGGRPPALAILLEVEQAYLHCAKAVIRSGLWDPKSWSPGAELPSAAQILSEHTSLADPESVAAALADSYLNRL